MASHSHPDPPTGATAGADKAAMKKALYEACSPFTKDNPKMTFHQADLLDLDIIPDDNVVLLMEVTQALCDDKLFKIVVGSDGVGWKLRTVDEAKKYRSLNAEQEAVYGLIDEAGDEGMWSKTIKVRTNLHDKTFRDCIKHLESAHMISDMKSVEHPTRKMYIKSSLSPSERATGGPWYTDGELDEEFIGQVMNLLYTYIKNRTFYESKSTQRELKRAPKKRVSKMSVEQIKAMRNEGLGPRDVETQHAEQQDERMLRRIQYESYFPMPAGYQGYPTLDELTLFVENGNFFTQILQPADIQMLLDIMCYDDRIEKTIAGSESVVYKALRRSLLDEDERGSVLTEAPCGRCPVFDLCEEGGPVGPSNCEYFNEWLAM